VALTILGIAIVTLMQLSSQGLRCCTSRMTISGPSWVADRRAHHRRAPGGGGYGPGGSVPVGAAVGLVAMPEALTRAGGRSDLSVVVRWGSNRTLELASSVRWRGARTMNKQGMGRGNRPRRWPGRRGFTLLEVAWRSASGRDAGHHLRRPPCRSGRVAARSDAPPISTTREALASCSSARWRAPSPIPDRTPTTGRAAHQSSRTTRSPDARHG